jgi:hypothetical protein
MREQAGEKNELRLPERRRSWKRWGLIVPAILLLTAGFFLGQAAGANTSSPGSEGDPLVTVSWVEARLAAFSRDGTAGSGSGSAQFTDAESQPFAYELINVPRGAKLLTGTGTEFILRSGRARAIAGAGGGIADLTSGQDLSNNIPIIRNHLLLSPKEDGRGVLMETESIFLIRGAYTTIE